MNYVKSKQRVADHGEVFTPAWLVEAMLDLVKDESERIDSRFLEPACGSGNFLVRILRRKLAAVELMFGKSDFEKRHYALLAVMCTYGIELLEDNIAECRAKLPSVLRRLDRPGSTVIGRCALAADIPPRVDRTVTASILPPNGDQATVNVTTFEAGRPVVRAYRVERAP